jgi:hypothetical protein
MGFRSRAAGNRILKLVGLLCQFLGLLGLDGAINRTLPQGQKKGRNVCREKRGARNFAENGSYMSPVFGRSVRFLDKNDPQLCCVVGVALVVRHLGGNLGCLAQNLPRLAISVNRSREQQPARLQEPHTDVE